MSIDAPPPSLPPQMSPDGKWIWDGAQWRPIPVHEAAFPNWKGVGAGFVPEVDTAAPAVAVAPPAARRGTAQSPSYRLAGPAPGLAVPNWGAGSKGLDVRRYGPMAIAAGGLIAVVVLVSVVATLILSNRQSPAPTTTVTAPKAGGPTSRSDSALAAYLIKQLDTPLSDLKDNTDLVRSTCAVGMTSACEDSMITIDNSVSQVVPILGKANVPNCIAAPETALGTDLANVTASQQLAIKGFNENKRSVFSTGVVDVVWYGNRVQKDYAAIKSAAAACDSALSGP